MSNPNMESTIRELMELRRMQEELTAEIEALQDTIKATMGSEEELTAGAFKVTWKPITTSRIDTTELRKALPDVAARFTVTSMTRRFCVN